MTSTRVSRDHMAALPRVGAAHKHRRRNATPTVLGVLFAIVWCFPLYWMLNTSFKTPGNLLSLKPSFLPIPFSVSNFVDAITRPGFLTSLSNSVVLALSVTGTSIILGFFAAAALAKYYFRGRSAILVIIIGVQMIPSTALVVPLFLSLGSFGLINTYVGLGLAYVSTALPFCVWLLRGFFQAVPKEIEEAALVDGASTMRILRSIFFPLVAPGLIATSVFAFINAWNDYILAYVIMKDQSKYTFPVWLVGFSSVNDIDYGGLIAASVLFTVPVVIFFLAVQKNLVSGMSAGAVKG